MSTNFYAIEETCKHCGHGGKEIHAGRRSCAGMFCWDCGVTLCKTGNGGVHSGSCQDDIWKKWHRACPSCGLPVPMDEDEGVVGRELGFNKSTPKKKRGVASCSSFSWAIEPQEIVKYSKFVDEYGTELTLEGMKDVLSECPIQFMHSIGQEFF